jgi:hypothetical protein
MLWRTGVAADVSAWWAFPDGSEVLKSIELPVEAAGQALAGIDLYVRRAARSNAAAAASPPRRRRVAATAAWCNHHVTTM